MRNSVKLFSVLILAVLLVTSVAPPAHAGFLGGVVDAVKSGVSSVTGAVKGAVSSVTGAVSGAVSSVVGAVKSGVSGVVGSITSGVSGVVDAVKGAVGGVVGAVKDVAGKVYETVKDTVKNVLGTITGTLPKVIEQVQGAVQGAAQGAVGGLAGAANGVAGMIDKAAGGAADIAGKLAGLPADIQKKVQDGIANIKDYISGKANDASNFLGMVKEFGVNLFENAKKTTVDLAGKGLDMLKDGAKAVNPILASIASLQAKGAAMAAEKALDVAKFVQEKAAEAPGFIEKLKTGAIGLFQKGQELADKYKGDAAETIAKNFEKLTGLRGDPAKYNKTFGEMFNVSAKEGNAAASASMSFGGYNIKTGADLQGEAGNEISKHQRLIKGEAWLGPKIDTHVEAGYLGGRGKMSLDNRFVAGLDAQFEGNAKWLTGGALVDAKGKVDVVAGVHNTTTFQNSLKLSENYGVKQTAIVDVVAGAQAKANGTLYAGKNGVEVSGGAEARVGLWADAKGSTAMQYKGQNLFTAEGSAGAGLGVGAGVKGGVAFRADKVGFNASVTLGPVKLGGGIYVNPVAMTEMAIDKGKQAVGAVTDTAKKVGNFLNPANHWPFK